MSITGTAKWEDEFINRKLRNSVVHPVSIRFLCYETFLKKRRGLVEDDANSERLLCEVPGERMVGVEGRHSCSLQAFCRESEEAIRMYPSQLTEEMRAS